MPAVLDVTNRSGDRVTARLPQDVDLDTTPSLRAIGDRIIDEGCRHLTLDASRMACLDSTGLTALILWWQRLTSLGGTLTLSSVDAHLYDVLRRLGLDSVLTITPRTAASDPSDG
ncbi:STAS domain-containing protein [Streptomyces galbus]|uniref:STAS domain-containing protein n=1 Tax=Streptomyces galbus TaxID=33898 RepID=UPI00144A9E42|nr:STAS domain-containing protein [Streptomyces galbus]GHD54106.1 hypothetical protein GCM10010335_68230 [Streptomyces galbus]